MIQTWAADVSSLLKEEVYQKYYGLVPVYRQEKADKLAYQKDRALSVGAWVLFMQMQETYGLSDEAAYNLSHSGTYVLCSVEDSGNTNVKVGCDLEKVKEERLKIAERFFCEGEYKYILGHPGSFYRYWVLKESFMKATRYGMKLALDAFEIRCGEAEEPVLIRKPSDIQGNYYFKEYDMGDVPYRAAVCSDICDFAQEFKIVKL